MAGIGINSVGDLFGRSLLDDEIFGIKPMKIECNDGYKVLLKNTKVTVDMPKKYIINHGATILIWNNGEKTIVKRCEDDEFNKRLGFLTAFFQHYSGMSKNKANKFLADLEVEDEVKEETETTESKFKIGDKVRIRKDIADTYSISSSVLERMRKNEYTIKDINLPTDSKKFYSYTLIESNYFFREDMLEFANKPKHMKEDN